MKVVTINKQVERMYEILEVYQAGIELRGSEVKSIRLGMVDIKHAFARIENNELILYNFHISKYPFSTCQRSYDPRRPKKLLLHRKEIDRILGRVSQKGLTLLPLKIYFNKRGYAKVEIALVKAKKLYDRREEIKKKIIDKEIRNYKLGKTFF